MGEHTCVAGTNVNLDRIFIKGFSEKVITE